jgi:NhaP-type Na+/H+ or K+/H+ antiporter
MTDRRRNPRSTFVFGGMVGGFVIGGWFSRWVLESQDDTLIAVAVGAVIGGAIMWFATRKRAQG